MDLNIRNRSKYFAWSAWAHTNASKTNNTCKCINKFYIGYWKSHLWWYNNGYRWRYCI